jgi:hypothetical protein
LDCRLKGDPIPPHDHVALHCQPAYLLDVDETGEAIGVSSDVFRVDDDGISTNWLEFQDADFETQFATACLLLTMGRTVRARHRVGIIVVANVLAAGAAANKAVSVIHDPLEIPPNPGHALITELAVDDQKVFQELAVVTELRVFTQEALRRSKAAESERRRT